ncbi:MAG: site-specific DNA-methyltransferase, partial [Planctomycetota bacterium]
MAQARRTRKPVVSPESSTAAYRHPEATTPLRPEVGTQAQFKKKKAPATYRYDSSLSPALAFDGQNGARELGEWLLARIEEASRLPGLKFATPQAFRDGRGREVLVVATLQDAVAALHRLSRP